MVLGPLSSVFPCIRLLLKLGSGTTIHPSGTERQEYVARGLQGEEGCPLCHCTQVFGNLWENKGTCTNHPAQPSPRPDAWFLQVQPEYVPVPLPIKGPLGKWCGLSESMRSELDDKQTDGSYPLFILI